MDKTASNGDPRCDRGGSVVHRVVMMTNGLAATIGGIPEVKLIAGRDRLALARTPSLAECRKYPSSHEADEEAA